MRPAPRGPRRLVLAVGLAVLVALAAGGRAAGGEEACVEAFGHVAKAFEARSADALLGCMGAEGTLTLGLSGLASKTDPMKRAQAQRVLRTYFAQVASASLQVKAGQAPESQVRAFDYTRRLRQHDPAITRLTVTLKKDASGVLRLQSLVESAR